MPQLAELRRHMTAEHARLDELLMRASGAEGSSEAYEQFRALLLRHIRIEERILLPMAERRRGAPLALAARLRLDHGALAGLVTLPPTPATIRALRVVLEKHNPLEEMADGVYEQCAALAGAEIDELMAQIAAAPEVRVSPLVGGSKATAAAKRLLARAGYDPAVLGSNGQV